MARRKMVSINCTCGKQFHVSETGIGRSGKCPSCQGKLRFVAPRFTPDEDAFQGTLQIVQGPNRVGDQYLLGGPGPIEIGKVPEKDIHLAGNKVSRSHCRLVRIPNGWRIEDQASTNGLFVNNQRLDTRELHDGDLVKIGEFELKFLDPVTRRASQTQVTSVRRSVKVRAVKAESVAQPVPATSSQPEADDPSALDVGLLDDNLYSLSDGDIVAVEQRAERVAGGRAAPAVPQAGGPICPSCQRSLAPNAKICIQCGIDLKNGRAILTSQAADLDTIYPRAESIIRVISWIMWLGIYPIASEAFGTRKPYFIRGVAILTVLTSIWFWAYEVSESSKMRTVKNYMLWAGQGEPSPEEVYAFYNYTPYGDTEAFQAKLRELSNQAGDEDAEPAAAQMASENPGEEDNENEPAASGTVLTESADESEEEDEEEEEEFESDEYEEDEDFFVVADPNLMLAAHKALPPDQQYNGHFAGYQLITHMFLHGDIFHLVGNLLFLLIFGSRVNALLGNVATVVLYPILGAVAGIAHMISVQSGSPSPMLGASGVIMGLAGLYLVLQAMHKMHMAIWMRWGLFAGFHLSLRLFAVRGFWVVLFYIAFDVVATSLGSDDGVAHWAHLGGFIGGVAVGFLLLLTRQVNSRGGDIVTGLLGRGAWALIGHPDAERKTFLDRVP